MKACACLILCCLVIACRSKERIDPLKARLIGTWETVPPDEEEEFKITVKDQTTFYASDSLVSSIYQDGKLIRTFRGTYQLEPNNKLMIKSSFGG